MNRFEEYDRAALESLNALSGGAPIEMMASSPLNRGVKVIQTPAAGNNITTSFLPSTVNTRRSSRLSIDANSVYGNRNIRPEEQRFHNMLEPLLELESNNNNSFPTNMSHKNNDKNYNNSGNNQLLVNEGINGEEVLARRCMEYGGEVDVGVSLGLSGLSQSQSQSYSRMQMQSQLGMNANSSFIRPSSSYSQSPTTEAKAEEDFWRLLQCLTTDRVLFDQVLDSPDLMKRNSNNDVCYSSCSSGSSSSLSFSDTDVGLDANTSFEDMLEAAFKTRRELRKGRTLMQWLEATAKVNLQQMPTAVTDIPWRETLRRLNTDNNANTNNVTSNRHKNSLGLALVTSMDPDAQLVSTDNGIKVLPLDRADGASQEALLRYVWQCLRCGNIALAQQAAMEHNAGWLAGCLRGSTNINNVVKSEYDTDMNVVIDGTGEPQSPEVDSMIRTHRPIWLQTCWRYSHKLAMQLSESSTAIITSKRLSTGQGHMQRGTRAGCLETGIYALLSCNTNALVSACKNEKLLDSWLDKLWERVRCAHEYNSSRYIAAHRRRRQACSSLYPGCESRVVEAEEAWLAMVSDHSVDLWNCENLFKEVPPPGIGQLLVERQHEDACNSSNRNSNSNSNSNTDVDMLVSTEFPITASDINAEGILAALQAAFIAGGNIIHSHLNVVMTLIINPLLHDMNSGKELSSSNLAFFGYARVLRVYAHLCIWLRSAKKTCPVLSGLVSDNMLAIFVGCYIDHLIQSRQVTLVPTYIAALQTFETSNSDKELTKCVVSRGSALIQSLCATSSSSDIQSQRMDEMVDLTLRQLRRLLPQVVVLEIMVKSARCLLYKGQDSGAATGMILSVSSTAFSSQVTSSQLQLQGININANQTHLSNTNISNLSQNQNHRRYGSFSRANYRRSSALGGLGESRAAESRRSGLDYNTNNGTQDLVLSRNSSLVTTTHNRGVELWRLVCLQWMRSLPTLRCDAIREANKYLFHIFSSKSIQNTMIKAEPRSVLNLIEEDVLGLSLNNSCSSNNNDSNSSSEDDIQLVKDAVMKMMAVLHPSILGLSLQTDFDCLRHAIDAGAESDATVNPGIELNWVAERNKFQFWLRFKSFVEEWNHWRAELAHFCQGRDELLGGAVVMQLTMQRLVPSLHSAASRVKDTIELCFDESLVVESDTAINHTINQEVSLTGPLKQVSTSGVNGVLKPSEGLTRWRIAQHLMSNRRSSSSSSSSSRTRFEDSVLGLDLSTIDSDGGYRSSSSSSTSSSSNSESMTSALVNQLKNRFFTEPDWPALEHVLSGITSSADTGTSIDQLKVCFDQLEADMADRRVIAMIVTLLVRALLCVCMHTVEALRSVDATPDVERCWLKRCIRITSLVASEDPSLKLYSMLPKEDIKRILEFSRVSSVRLLELSEDGQNQVNLCLEEDPL